MSPFTDAEYKRILDTCGARRSKNIWERRNRAIVLVLLNTGLRRKEVAGLLISDYHPDQGHISVRRSNAKRTKSRDDSRTTVIWGDAKVELDNYIRLLNYSGKATGPLFPSERGHALRPDGITSFMGRTIRRAQEACPKWKSHQPGLGCGSCVRRGGVHRWRATWAIRTASAGVPLQSIMTLGGWSNAEMPMRYMRKALGEIALKDMQRAKLSQAS